MLTLGLLADPASGALVLFGIECEKWVSNGSNDCPSKCGSPSSSFPRSDMSVDFWHGDKLEFATDFVVALSGEDFVWSREYTSNPQVDRESGPELIIWPDESGNKWMFPALPKVSATNTRMNLFVAAQKVTHLVRVSGTEFEDAAASFASTGASTLRTTMEVIEYDDRYNAFGSGPGLVDVPVIELTDPGVGSTFFFRPLASYDASGTESPSTRLQGLPAGDADVYGNTRWYEYNLASQPSSTSEPLRITAIRCVNADGYLEARIELDWIQPGSAWNPLDWRLRRVRVLRPESACLDSSTSCTLTEAQRVEYKYFDDFFPPPDPQPDPLDPVPAEPNVIGSSTDLVQVVTYERVDANESAYSTGGVVGYPARTRVWQYRYYYGGEPSEIPSEGGCPECFGEDELDDALEDITDTNGSYIYGDVHQLRMVVGPRQIERYAAERATATLGLEPPGTPLTLLGYAESLISSEALTWFNSSGVERPITDLAAKVIVYEPDNDRKVKLQYLIEPDCGCGGSGFAQDRKRLQYNYLGYGSSDYHRTTIIEEAGWINGSFTPYRNHFKDLALLGVSTHEEEEGEHIPSFPNVPYLINDVVQDADDTSKKWVTHYVYDFKQRVVRVMHPSAMASYSTSSSGPTYVAKETDGLVEAFSYTADNRLEARWIGKGAGIDPDTSAAPQDLELGARLPDEPDPGTHFKVVERFVYGSDVVTGERSYLVKTHERFRLDGEDDPDSASDDDVERTFFTYGFYTSGGADVAWIKREVEQDLVAENGPGVDEDDRYTSFELFDAAGRNAWSIDADGGATKRTFHGLSGEVASVTENANWSNSLATTFGLPSGADSSWTTDNSTSGGALKTTWVRDALGRVVDEISPGGVHRYVRRVLRDIDEWPAVPYYAKIEFPHVLSSTGPVVDGPVRWIAFDAEDAELEAGSAAPASMTLAGGTVGDFTHPVSAYTLQTSGGNVVLLSREEWSRSLAGAVSINRRWHDANDAGAFYETEHVYDGLGRLRVEVNPNGTARRFSYDVRDRLTKVEEGTLVSGTASALRTDGSGNLVPVELREYDHILSDGSANTSGIGDGNLTKMTELVDASSGNNRETVMRYDFRNRRTWTVSPETPHELRVYDNLGRVVSRSLYATAPTTSTPAVTARGLHEEFGYSQRSSLYRRARAIDPGSATPSFVEWHSWFDEDGHEIAAWGPNAPATKREFDGLGRVVKESMTDRGGDAAPGATGTHAAAASLSGDIVFEQMSYIFHADTDGEGDHLGEVMVEATRRRAHDATIVGDIASHTGEEVIATFIGFDYDDADRVVAAIDFGTNVSGFEDLRYGGTAPTSSNITTPPSFARVWETTYNARGLVDTESSAREVGSPAARILTKHIYDDLDRRIAVIENWTGAEIEPGLSANGGFALDLGSSHTTGDASQDRTTITVYNGVDDVIFLVAAHDDGTGSVEYQATEYIYGVAKDAGTPPTSPFTGNPGADDSRLFSNDLLARIVYPDSETSVDDHSVRYRYNRRGELIGMTDQNGTEHAYSRDTLGRLTRDDATAIASGIDGWIDRIDTTYDDMGRRETVKSKLASSGAVRNAVKFEYNGLWQVERVTQNPAGDLAGAHEGVVSYSFQLQNVSSGNYSRLRTIEYPEDLPWSGQVSPGTTLKYLYGAKQYEPAGPTPSDPTLPFPMNDAVSRVDGMTWITLPDDVGTGAVDESQLPLVEYRYLGMHDFVYTRYHYPALRLDRSVDTLMPSGGAATGFDEGVYPGLDRFGRTRRQTWIRDNWSLGAKPAIFDLQYEYDEDSNVVDRFDRRAEDRATRPGRDETYRYDSLNRLSQADRGSHNHSSGVFTIGGLTNAGLGELWGLDGVGNWIERRRNTLNATTGGGDPDFAASGNLLDERTFSDANEIQTQALDAGGARSQQQDLAGSLTVRRFPLTSSTYATWLYTYDAWNRLVRVSVDPDDDGVAAPQDRVRYSYNGLHWRATRVADRDADMGNTPDQANMYYYDASWRLLEERIDDEFASDWSTGAPSGSSGDFSLFDGGDVDGAGDGASGDRVVQRFWRGDYIDALIAQASCSWNATEEEYDEPETHYALTDRLHSVLTMTTQAGAIAERVRHTPYGEARHAWPGDVDGDGAVTFGVDQNQFLNRYGKGYGDGADYSPDFDFDQDGSIGFADLGPATSLRGALPAGMISGPGAGEVRNTVGYSGYQFDPAAGPRGLYLSRHRWYDPALGAWVTRDPIGYADGMGLYEYVAGDPLWGIDPSGLSYDVPRLPGPPGSDRQWNSPDDWKGMPGSNPNDIYEGPRGYPRSTKPSFKRTFGNWDQFLEDFANTPGSTPGLLSCHGNDKDGPYMTTPEGTFPLKDVDVSPDLRERIRTSNPRGLWIHACGSDAADRHYQEIADKLGIPIYRTKSPRFIDPGYPSKSGTFDDEGVDKWRKFTPGGRADPPTIPSPPTPPGYFIGCFASDTPVATQRGLVAIEQLTIRSSVAIEDGSSRTIRRIYKFFVTDLISIYVNGEVIVATPEHPFLSAEGWVRARDLAKGMKLRTLMGTEVLIDEVVPTVLDAPIPVYNLEVDRPNIFGVGANGVIVHNKNA